MMYYNILYLSYHPLRPRIAPGEGGGLNTESGSSEQIPVVYPGNGNMFREEHGSDFGVIYLFTYTHVHIIHAHARTHAGTHVCAHTLSIKQFYGSESDKHSILLLIYSELKRLDKKSTSPPEYI